MKSIIFGLFLFLFNTQLTYALDTVEQAHSLLQRMSAAHRELNYQGVFTYEHAGVLRSIRIKHSMIEGLEYESLQYLNGPDKTVTRSGMSSECRQRGDDFLPGLPMAGGMPNQIENHYELFLRGEDRIAGRTVRIIHIIPKDNMRYGYILAVDKEKGLLLQSLMVGPNRKVMERFQYVDIQFDQVVAEELVATSGVDEETAGCQKKSINEVSWQARWLPSGYELIGSQELEPGSISLVYTDGMSFVSIFVNSGDEASYPPIQAQRGATVAQIARVIHSGQEYAICVVGEIPPSTAEKIAKFVAPVLP